MILLKRLLNENFQLAMKLYGDKLTPEDITFLTRLSGKDYTFKTLAELLIQDKVDGEFFIWQDKEWNDALSQLRNYNKNVFPIEGFSFDSTTPIVRKQTMTDRAEIIKIISGWPSIARRNLRGDIAWPRRDFGKLRNTVDYIDMYLQFLENRTDEQKEAILRKIFNSTHPTFEDVINFVDEKKNLLQGGKAYSKLGLKKLVDENKYDLEIVYSKRNIVVVDVISQPGIKLIGCNSLWCFTYGSVYGSGGRQFDEYSYNGHVYAIVDFDYEQTSPAFIRILIRPFENQVSHDATYLYDMANDEEYGDVAKILVKIAHGDKSILKVFKWGDV